MNPIMIGILGHVITFGVGYIISVIAGGFRPEDVDELRFRRSNLAT